MKGKSILLALSGSQQSRYAAEVCWKLAGKLAATVTAHHVVDAHSAWEFLGHDKPGFLKTTAYLEEYQELVCSLFRLAENLAETYAEEAKEQGLEDECIISEGNPVNEICRRSANHKLVVIGHQKSKSHQEPRSQFQRLSVAEALANDCPRPLLVVQDDCPAWTSMSIMISLDHINKVYIDSCLDMAEAMGLPPTLLCLTGGAHEERPEDFVKNMRAADERFKDLPITLARAQQNIDINVLQWYAPPNKPFDKELWSNTLIVLPTRMVAGDRLTVVDSSPSLFVRYLELPSILLWPEEYAFRFEKEAERRELSSVS